MAITIAICGYLVVGIILSFIWWNDEYKPEEEENGEIEVSMACIFLALLVIFWPLKLIKNWLEGLVS